MSSVEIVAILAITLIGLLTMPTFYGLAEIADAIGISRNLARQWLRRGKLPAPTARLAMGPLWTGRVIERFIEEHRGHMAGESSAAKKRRSQLRRSSARAHTR